MRLLRLFFPLLLALVACAQATALTYDIDVNVTNRKGDAVKNANVVISGPIGLGEKTTQKTGTTNEFGRVSFSMPRKGEYNVTVTHPDHKEFSSTVTLSDPISSHGFIAVLSLKSTVNVDFSVVDDKGKPISGAKLALQFADKTPYSTSSTTSAEGTTTISLPVRGTWAVTVTHDHYTTHTGNIFLESAEGHPKFTITLKSSSARLRVSVLSDDRDEPIAGASVTVTSVGGPGVDEHLPTDGSGVVYFIVRGLHQSGGRKYNITVSHPDFETKTGTVQADSAEYKDYDCPFRLKRKAGHRTVTVQVVDTNGEAIAGANVALYGAKYDFRGSTDINGRAVISVDRAGTYTVTVTRTGYATASDKVHIADSDESPHYSVDIELEATRNEWRRAVRVTVKGKNKEGKVGPVANAQIVLSTGPIGKTDANGRWEFLHTAAPGEELKATVSADGFAKATGSVTVRAGGTLFNPNLKAKKKLDLSKGTAIEKINVLLVPGGGLSGNIIPAKGRVKVKENVPVTFAVTYEGGVQTSVRVNQTIQLFGPSGNLIKTFTVTGTYKIDVNNRQTYVFSGSLPGTYTVKARYSGPDGLYWTDSAKFDVVGAKPNSAKPGATEADADFSGLWIDGNSNELTLKQVGNKVTGSTRRGFKATGTVKGRTLTIRIERYHETTGLRWTNAVFKLQPGDKEMMGKYTSNYGETSGSRWIFKKQ